MAAASVGSKKARSRARRRQAPAEPRIAAPFPKELREGLLVYSKVGSRPAEGRRFVAAAGDDLGFLRLGEPRDVASPFDAVEVERPPEG